LHPEFSQKSSVFDKETKKVFIESAYTFFMTAQINVQERLPFMNSILLLCDCFLLKDTNDCFNKMRKLGASLPNIVNQDRLTIFYDEVHKLQKDIIEIRDSINFMIARSATKNFLESWEAHKKDYL